MKQINLHAKAVRDRNSDRALNYRTNYLTSNWRANHGFFLLNRLDRILPKSKMTRKGEKQNDEK